MKSFITSVFLGFIFVIACLFRPMETTLQTLPEVRLNAGIGWLECSDDGTKTTSTFPVYYLGKWKKTINIISNPNAEFLRSVKRPHPELLFDFATAVTFDYITSLPQEKITPYDVPLEKGADYPFPKHRTLKITVGKPFTAIGQGKKALGGFEFRPIFIENISSDTVLVGHDNILPLMIESWNNNKWERVYRYGGECGTGWVDFFLPPGEMAVTVGHFEAGKIYQLRLGYDYSNTFKE